jgi:cell division protease FtsH
MKKTNYNMKGGPSNFILLGLLILLSIGGLAHLVDIKRNVDTLKYSQLVGLLKEKNVKSVKIAGSDIRGIYKDRPARRFESVIPENDPKVKNLLEDQNVEIEYEPTGAGDLGWWNVIILGSLIIIPLGLWFFLRQNKGSSGSSGSNIFNVGKSKAKMFMPSQIKVNFDSVAGVAEAKEDLKEVVDFLKNPEKYKRLGAKLTRGALLVGDPGNGKTLLAKAVAGEANCPFYSISGADFIEVFVGVGAARVRDLFAQARKNAPSIIFIDEIDAVGRKRGNGMSGGSDEREQTLNQLLTEMDGFNTDDTSVVVMAATNRPDVLDKALLRPGRFDRRIDVPYPDINSREKILNVHARTVQMDPAIDLRKVARGTPGFSGADLANLINESAIIASKANQNKVKIENVEQAYDKIILGKPRKDMVRDQKELEVTAYHEAGHAMLILMQPEYVDPLHKVTIVSHEKSLGVTVRIPEKDVVGYSKQEMLAQIRVALAGRAAEELIFKDVTTGASDDFRKSTDIARKMIAIYGMSEKLGPVLYHKDPSSWYQYSEATARVIDEEVKSLIDKLYKETLDVLVQNRDKFDMLAQKLLDQETLYAGQVYELLDIDPRYEVALR